MKLIDILGESAPLTSKQRKILDKKLADKKSFLDAEEKKAKAKVAVKIGKKQ